MGRAAVKADPLLPLYREQHAGQAGQDRLELLTALIGGPAFDPLFRCEVIRIPPRHPVFRWACLVDGCNGPARAASTCATSTVSSGRKRRPGGRHGCVPRRRAAAGGVGLGGAGAVPDLPGPAQTHTSWRMCHRHYMRWYRCQRSEGQRASFEDWLPARSRSTGTGRARRRSARTWRPRRWACAQATSPGTRHTARRAVRRCRRPGPAAMRSGACQSRSPLPTRSSSAPGAPASRRCRGRARSSCPGWHRCRPRRSAGACSLTPSGNGTPAGRRLGAGTGQHLPGPPHQIADRA